MKITVHPLSPQSPSSNLPADQELIERLERSFRQFAAREGELADCFHGLLFHRHPAVRPMFPEEMSDQKKKLTAALAMVVANLRTPDQVRGALREMGQRHVGYGTRPEHYELVCSCLVAAMAMVGGSDWTAELGADWLTALRLVSTIMLEGASEPV